jgi:hypothetical protein
MKSSPQYVDTIARYTIGLASPHFEGVGEEVMNVEKGLKKKGKQGHGRSQ